MVETEKNKLDSKHEGFVISPTAYKVVSILRSLVYLLIVLWISHPLYCECLFHEKANPIVVTYFCLISFGCILNLGLPLDKFSNISLSGK